MRDFVVARGRSGWGADHRFHHRGGGCARHPRALGRGDIAVVSGAGPWPTAVGDAGFQAARVRPTSSTGAGLRIRSAHCLVGPKARRAAVARHGATRACGSKHGPLRQVLWPKTVTASPFLPFLRGLRAKSSIDCAPKPRDTSNFRTCY